MKADVVQKRKPSERKLLWRFCQQCGRLEPLSCFSGKRRSCSASLARRRDAASAVFGAASAADVDFAASRKSRRRTSQRATSRRPHTPSGHQASLVVVPDGYPLGSGQCVVTPEGDTASCGSGGGAGLQQLYPSTLSRAWQLACTGGTSASMHLHPTVPAPSMPDHSTATCLAAGGAARMLTITERMLEAELNAALAAAVAGTTQGPDGNALELLPPTSNTTSSEGIDISDCELAQLIESELLAAAGNTASMMRGACASACTITPRAAEHQAVVGPPPGVIISASATPPGVTLQPAETETSPPSAAAAAAAAAAAGPATPTTVSGSGTTTPPADFLARLQRLESQTQQLCTALAALNSVRRGECGLNGIGHNPAAADHLQQPQYRQQQLQRLQASLWAQGSLSSAGTTTTTWT
jgi:SBP domain